MKKIICTAIFVVLLGLFVSPVVAAPIPYRPVARDGHLELYFNDRTGAIRVRDHRNGHVWRSVVCEEMYDLSGVNRLWATDMRSPLVIHHSNILLRDAPALLLRSYDFVDWVNPDTNQVEQTIFSTPIHNGLEVEFRFPSLGLSVTVLYWLEDGALVVRIPTDRIVEEMYTIINAQGRPVDLQQAITAINLFPYFGAAGRHETGYIFYPDGSGAITRFENWAERPQAMITERFHIFADTSGDTDGIINGQPNTISMPVVGIRNGNNAFLAAITEGYDHAMLAVHPAGAVIDLYRASFSLNFRGTFEINMSAISGATGRALQMATRVDRDLIMVDKEVRYFILYGDDANYSGMARAYRDHLLATGYLQNNITNPGRLPLNLQLFMGIEEQGMLFNTFVPMTTFDQTADIITDLQNRGVENMETMLRGWQSGGFSWSHVTWPPASRLGGRRGLTRLDTFMGTDALPGVHVYLENEFTLAQGNSRGFSPRRDVAINGVRLPLQSTWGNFFALRPGFSEARNRDFIGNLSGMPNLNVAYLRLGNTLLADYNRNDPFTRKDVARTYAGMTAYAAADGRRVMLDGANVFMLRDTNFLYDIPNSSRRLFMTDECVPFVQMVVSGLIGHSSEKGNLASNLQIATLQWVEFGSVPAFELTYRDSVNLQNTNYANLFTSTFSNWVDDVVEVYHMLNARIGHVFGLQMVSHERLAPCVVRVAYADGTIIFINYNNHEVTIEGVTIPPIDFTVIR